MDRILTLMGGIFWIITYIEIIRCGIRDKTCSMPLIAIGLNFSWELLFLINNKFNDIKILFIINVIWIILDIVIGYLYFKYNGKNFKKKKYFIPYSILFLITGFVFEFAFHLEYDGKIAASSCASFFQNAVMSILFFNQRFLEGKTKGQSLLLALSKMLGTLFMVIAKSVFLHINAFILAIGIICYTFDVLYVLCFLKKNSNKVNLLRG